MKFSINWAQKYSNVDLKAISPDQLIASIGEQLGAVEEVEDLAQKYKDVYIVKLVRVVKHPDSDKLSLCLIDDAKQVKNVKRNADGLVQIVCGAPNVKVGMLAAWIPPGAIVPSTFSGKPLVLEAKKLRGKTSHGMLASPKELDLSDEHEGILEVPAKNKQVKAGALFGSAYGLDDLVIDLENKMFTHRPDCFGMLGVARELAGINNQQFESPDWYTATGQKIASGFDSKNDIPSEVPRFTLQVVKGIEVKPSSQEIQNSLIAVGSKPINNIVDLTNYYMHLTAQPTHAFDYDKVKKLCAGKVSIFPRLAKTGEKLQLLTGKTIELTDKDIVIATDKQPIALAGIMGGKATEVDSTTKNIIIECANFNMYTIRRSSMHHGLFTDAVTRFNKGQSSLQNAVVLSKLTQAIVEDAGGKAADGYDSNPEMLADHWPAIKVNSDFVNSRLGSDISATEMASLLQNVEFSVAVKEKSLAVSPPYWRTDISIVEDIVEEIGRLYGYSKLPVELPSRLIRPVVKNSELQFKQDLRRILSAAGANEVLSYSFVSEKLLTNCGQDPSEAYKLSNALSPQLQYYRMSLTPSLLSRVHQNIKAGYSKFVIYEINKTHLKSHGVDSEGLPIEMEMFSLVYGSDSKQHPAKAGSAYYQAKAYLDHIAQKLGTSFHYQKLDKKPAYQVASPFDWQRSALVTDHNSGNTLGMIGEFNRSTARNLKLPENCSGFEINYKQLMESVGSLNRYLALAKFPSTTKDITIEVPLDYCYGLLAGYVEHVIEQLAAKQPLRISSQLIDIFHKKSAKSKNITIRITMSNKDKTLTSDQATAISEQISKYLSDNIQKTDS